MTDTTIANIAREKVVLDDTEWFEGEDGTGSFKSRIQSIRGTGEVAVTTSAVSQNAGPDEQLVLVTSSGSGLGTDKINLVLLTLDGNNFNGQRVGQRIIVQLADQVDPSDQVHITIGGSGTVFSYNEERPITNWTDVWLDFPGGFAVFVWTGYGWSLDVDASDGPGSFEGKPGTSDYTIQSVPTQPGDPGPGTRLAVVGGYCPNGKGGPVQFFPGESDTGDGGDIVFRDNAGGRPGSRIRITASLLPTADPHDAGVLWSNGGVLTISAG